MKNDIPYTLYYQKALTVFSVHISQVPNLKLTPLMHGLADL